MAPFRKGCVLVFTQNARAMQRLKHRDCPPQILALLGAHSLPVHLRQITNNEDTTMKTRDAKKETKKAPLKSAKEKKVEKREKKGK